MHALIATCARRTSVSAGLFFVPALMTKERIITLVGVVCGFAAFAFAIATCVCTYRHLLAHPACHARDCAHGAVAIAHS